MSSVLEKILNIIFPENCIVCFRSGGYICDTCIENIEYLQEQPYQNLHIYALYSFKNASVQELLKIFKYKRATSIAAPLAHKLAPFITQIAPLSKNTQYGLIPIPTTKKSIKQRGFNQAHLLAQELAKTYPKQFILCPILVKKPRSKQQTSLSSREERIKNSEDMFIINGELPNNVTPIIIDDVTTTGATMRAAQSALQKITTQKICGVAVAYQPKLTFEI